MFDAVKMPVLACWFSHSHTVGPSRLFPKFRNLLVTWYVRTERSTNQSVRSANPSLLSVIMISLPSAKTFHAVIVLLFLRNSSRISTVDTSVRNGTESHHCHCLVWVICLFMSQYSGWQRGISRNGLQVKTFPLHGIILCSRTGDTYIYCNQTETVVNWTLMCSRTGHTYIYLQP